PDFYVEKARTPRRLGEKKKVIAPEQEPPRTIVPRRLTGVAALIASIGEPGAEHLEYASNLLAYLAPPIRDALRDPLGAQSVMLGFVLEGELTLRNRQLGAVGREDLARKTEVIAPLLRQLDRAYRLPLVALAIPVLKALPEAERHAFLAALRGMVQADQRYTLSEFVLATILDWTLGPKAKRAGGIRYKSLGEVAAETGLVLSLFAYAGTGASAGTDAPAQAAFDKGRETMGQPSLSLTGRDTLQLNRVSDALARLSALSAPEKARLLEGCAATVAVDGDVRLLEHELLRAVACVLDCPMPPSAAGLDPRLLRK